VPPPDPAARAEILSVLCRNKPASEADLNRIAHATNGYSGADLKAVIDRAAQRLLVESLRDGVIRSITTNDLLAATAEITPTTTEWFLDVRNYVRYQNQTGFYDAVRPYLK